MQIVNYRKYGEHGPVILILHGIFGMLDNWQYHAKLLSTQFQVYTVDARNHGKSFHSDTMSYEEMATDLVNLALELGIDKFHLIGHSMGGKTAMKFAELYNSYLLSLIIVDIAPKAYPPGHIPYFKAFLELPLHSYSSRSEVDDAFKMYAPETGVRQFLLKNLEANETGGYKTKSNMTAIQTFYHEIIGDFNLQPACFGGKCTFVYGAKSGYIKPEDHERIKQFFTHAQFISISNAGHWVHADNPQEFYEVLVKLLN